MKSISARSRTLAEMVCCWGIVLGTIQPAHATTNHVTNLNDSGPGSLRQAIADAAPGDTIDFAVTGTITLTSSELVITNNLTVAGPGTNLLTISGNNQFRVFAMNFGTTNTLSGLTIAGGMVTNGLSGQGPPYPPYMCGAGISNDGSLVLSNCAVRACTNLNGYGTFWIAPGGGIYNSGELLMKHCEVSDCLCGSYILFVGLFGGTGGGIANVSDLRMEGCMVSRCNVGGVGGGIANTGDLRMGDCTVSDCRSGSQKHGSGGGIHSSANLLLTNCIVKSCSSVDGGGISAENVTIHSCTIVSNRAYGYSGGGIQGRNCSITNSTIADNRAYHDGGGLWFSGTNVMVGCTVSGNDSLETGGGYSPFL